MAILGGSPLGLINVRSNPNPSGRSTFNDGNTRNINVFAYNAGDYNASFRGNSLFSGDRVVRAWPGIEAYSTSMPGSNDVDYTNLKGGTSSKTPQGNFKQRKKLHNNDVYDTSILNIIEHLAGTSGSLKMADFAYLKDVGVYPNNRLMIARRFGGPIGDNIIKPKATNAKGQVNEYGPLATLISWLPADTDFLNISFGEKWTDAEADFKELLNKIGGDIQSKGSSGAGNIMESVSNAIPLPGFTEIFQRKFLANMGIFDEDAGETIPSGNPNLIKEAKRRTTIAYESAGSGLMCEVTIEMNCEYELKFISGIDPTIVWMDILGMILRFGTSPSNTYGLGKDISSKVDGWLKNPYALVKEVVGKIGVTLTGIKETLEDEINVDFNDKYDQLWGLNKYADKKKDGNTQQMAQNNALYDVKKLGLKFVEYIGNVVGPALNGLAMKYKVEILGIVNALSGLPSTPWHITIGNPLRPVFCAGDMYTTSVKIALGPNLAFNDLPASIKVSFSLANARPWGLQEIMSKFNSGYLRTVDVQKSFYEINLNEAVGQFDFEANPPAPDSGTASAPLGGSQSTPIPSTGDFANGGRETVLEAAVIRKNTGSSTKATDGQVPKKV
jgi:hypothetical protein